MNRRVISGFVAVLHLAAWLGATVQPATAADVLEQSIGVAAGTAAASAKSQDKVNALDDEAKRMLAEYRATVAQLESLQVYNDQLTTLTDSQRSEFDSLDQQLAGIETTRRGIVPLLKRMIDTLDAFREYDLPFLVDERRVRILNLRRMMDRADVSMAEKYRRVMEAWQAESKYGRSIEAYRTGLQQGGDYRIVDFLRVGRVALVYQTLDGRETGYWDRGAAEWRRLPDDYRLPVKKALNIARKRAAPDLLVLPVSAARDASR